MCDSVLLGALCILFHLSTLVCEACATGQPGFVTAPSLFDVLILDDCAVPIVDSCVEDSTSTRVCSLPYSVSYYRTWRHVVRQQRYILSLSVYT